MAGMLQALKNLEARGASGQPAAPRPGAGTAAARSTALATCETSDLDALADLAASLEPTATPVRPARRTAGDAATRLNRPAAPLPVAANAAAPPLGGAASPAANPFVAQVEPPASGAPLAVGAPVATCVSGLELPTAVASAPRRPLTSAALRPDTALERLVRRTLGDPIRSQPLVQLAERLERDIQQTGSKSVLFIGVGSESTAAQTLLHVAPLLAERMAGDVLLVDADLPRRPLTERLELGRHVGVADLVGRGEADHAVQPTSFSRLHFLPAGQARHVDLSAAIPGLERLLERLAARFACLLIDGGSTSELAASALARVADAAYFVVQLGTVEVSTAQAALRDFRAAGARVLGCVAT